MPVVSDPLKHIVQGGRNIKYVKACTELALGCQGLEQLGGFTPLVNLERLWLDGNKLRAISGLEANVRLKELYVQNNKLVTLAGSLRQLKFLTKLDVSGNQLRGLDKVLGTLQHLRFLSHLNIKGNPCCCEEPSYRATVLAALPQLEVLDLHTVTPLERHRALQAAGGGKDAAARATVAFGCKVPSFDASLTAMVPVRSAIERELQKEVAGITAKRQQQQAQQQQQELDQLLDQQAAAATCMPAKGSPLPKPPGLVAALRAWAEDPAAGPTPPAGLASSQHMVTTSLDSTAKGSLGSTARSSTAASKAGGEARASAYRPRDTFVLYSCRRGGGQSPRATLGASGRPAGLSDSVMRGSSGSSAAMAAEAAAAAAEQEQEEQQYGLLSGSLKRVQLGGGVAMGNGGLGSSGRGLGTTTGSSGGGAGAGAMGDSLRSVRGTGSPSRVMQETFARRLAPPEWDAQVQQVKL